jgi:hypothetical protein
MIRKGCQVKGSAFPFYPLKTTVFPGMKKFQRKTDPHKVLPSLPPLRLPFSMIPSLNSKNIIIVVIQSCMTGKVFPSVLITYSTGKMGSRN